MVIINKILHKLFNESVLSDAIWKCGLSLSRRVARNDSNIAVRGGHGC